MKLNVNGKVKMVLYVMCKVKKVAEINRNIALIHIGSFMEKIFVIFIIFHFKGQF